MAVIFTKQKRKQKYLIIITAIVLGVSGVVLWLGYFGEKKPISPPVAVTKLREMKIDLEILESPLLKEFQLFERTPPLEDGKGRENPFLPY